MIKFSILGFGVRVHWTFGLVALFIAGGFRVSDPDQWGLVLAGMAVIFVSILVHELGHAFAGHRFGAKPVILLHSMGGLCYLPGGRFSRRESILVSLAGPAAGFLLAGVTVAIFHLLAPAHGIVRYALGFSLFVNVIWTALNLLPILPLDGGQIFRDLLGPSRIQVVRWVGAATASLLCLAAFTHGFLIGGIISGILAFMNFRGSTMEGGVVKEVPFHRNADAGR